MSELSNTTRTRIISSLRGGERTVKDLKTEIGLTGNAIRLHLEALERQGLVSRSGIRRGTRKPHYTYNLTSKAQRILFESCEPLLSELLAALTSRLPKRTLQEVLSETANRLAAANALPTGKSRNRKERIHQAMAVLKKLGGTPSIQESESTLLIQSPVCPWAIITAKHKEVCLIAEELLSQLIGVEVKQHCVRGESPECHFRIRQPAAWI